MPGAGDPTPPLREVRSLFDRAQELGPAERLAFVRDNASDDSVADEVISLLRANDTAVSALFNEARRVMEGVADSALPGNIGHYRIIARLGEGGMGVVYRAERPDLRDHVAVKVCRAIGVANSEAMARFQLEQRALAAMSHRCIAKVFDAGTDTTGQPYFVMELVNGVPLTTWCDRHRLTLPQRLRLFALICEGVQHAHNKSVIHRDLKPTNVLVVDEGGAAVPKILDFGLAKATDPALYDTPFDMTGADRAIGTLLYMSPEQAGGHSSDVDARGDIYSLGVMLYELLVGDLPVPATMLEQAQRVGGRLAVLRLLCEQEPDLMSVRVGTVNSAVAIARRTTPERLRRLLQGDLDQIVRKAMAKDATLRYPTATSLCEDIGRYLEQQPVLACPPAWRYRVAKFVRRNRVGVLAAGLVVLTAVVGAALVTSFAIEKATALANYLLLADVVQLSDAKAIASALHPAFPERAPEMRSWLQEHGWPLQRRLPVLEAALVQLRSRSLSESVGANGESVIFADPADRFLHQALSRLVVDLRAFAGPKGELAAVQARLAEAMTVYDRSVVRYRSQWDAAAAAIAVSDGRVASQRYAQMKLLPQVGLVPLGMDPDSRLWEFVHLGTGTPGREFPERDPITGKITPTADMGIVFVLLPGETFFMGAQAEQEGEPNYDKQAEPKEMPVHPVRLDAYFLSKYEMTQSQWLRVAGDNPSHHQSGSPFTIDWKLQPVEKVSHRECVRQLELLGLCLPTEAQWEHAARAGGTTPWCVPYAELASVANLADAHAALHGGQPSWVFETALDDGFVAHAPIGRRPNAFGLHDMHGNVFEWCEEEYQTYRQNPDAGTGRRSGRSVNRSRIARGGAFDSTALFARVSHRYAKDSDAREMTIGLRPARRVVKAGGSLSVLADPAGSTENSEHAPAARIPPVFPR